MCHAVSCEKVDKIVISWGCRPLDAATLEKVSLKGMSPLEAATLGKVSLKGVSLPLDAATLEGPNP